MPRRATKRGAERTPLTLDADVLICGASFAGLAVARERAGSGVDSLGWRRVLSKKEPGIQPPKARLSRGLEVHPRGTGEDLELWLDKKYVRPGYSWSFPAGDEVRVGVGSFNPKIGVKAP